MPASSDRAFQFTGKQCQGFCPGRFRGGFGVTRGSVVVEPVLCAGRLEQCVVDSSVLECRLVGRPGCVDALIKALSRVEGVIEAKVTWEPKEAVVTYDDTNTSPAALTQATENAGYPSTVKE